MPPHEASAATAAGTTDADATVAAVDATPLSSAAAEAAVPTKPGDEDVEAAAPPTSNPGRTITFADGKASFFLVGDKLIRKWSIIVLCGLLLSWTAQWVAYGLPYWRGDDYHHGGFFQVCGTTDLYFNASAKNGAGEIYPNLTSVHPETCIPTKQYCDDFYNMLLDGVAQYNGDLNKVSIWLSQAEQAFPRILSSRAFEALGTLFSMIFGTTTIMMVILPTTSPRVNNINGVIALIGIFLTPWFALIDLFISINTWDYIGVGYFDTNGVTFLYVGGQLAIATSIFDFLVQFAFLWWGARRLKLLYPEMFIEDKEKAAAAAAAVAAAASGSDSSSTATSTRPAFEDSYSAMGPAMSYRPRPRPAKKA
ncbi:hypothetical protein HK405_007889 [Cladochytrium tenue]|nr:hypothetical protein HK405_007889 [Cladochytrium tenue]